MAALYNFNFDPLLRARCQAEATESRRNLKDELHVLLEEALKARQALKTRKPPDDPETVLAEAERFIARGGG